MLLNAELESIRVIVDYLVEVIQTSKRPSDRVAASTLLVKIARDRGIDV